MARGALSPRPPFVGIEWFHYSPLHRNGLPLSSIRSSFIPLPFLPSPPSCSHSYVGRSFDRPHLGLFAIGTCFGIHNGGMKTFGTFDLLRSHEGCVCLRGVFRRDSRRPVSQYTRTHRRSCLISAAGEGNSGGPTYVSGRFDLIVGILRAVGWNLSERRTCWVEDKEDEEVLRLVQSPKVGDSGMLCGGEDEDPVDPPLDSTK